MVLLGGCSQKWGCGTNDGGERCHSFDFGNKLCHSLIFGNAAGIDCEALQAGAAGAQAPVLLAVRCKPETKERYDGGVSRVRVEEGTAS